MSYHTEFMIVELLNIYEQMTEESTIKLETLEKAFYTFQDILNSKEHLKTSFIFEEELDKLIETIPGFSLVSDELVVEDLTAIYEELIKKYPTLTDIDGALEEYVQNLAIYNDLELDIPLEDTKNYFYLNELILKYYIVAAEYEFEGKNNQIILLIIKQKLKELEKELENVDELMINKIKMCLSYYNSIYLNDYDENFNNRAWKVILFGNRNQLVQLKYDKLQYMCELYTDINDNILLDNEDQESTSITNIDDDLYEIPLFLTYYIITLNRFLNKYNLTLTKEIKEDLIIKKYLLFASSEIEKIENHLLTTGSIDNLNYPPIIPGTFTESSFAILKPTVIERTLSLDYSDNDIKKDSCLYSKLITSALFIKTFLDLSINDNDKNDIKDLLINNRFYKNDNYRISTNIIDTYIFADNNLKKGL